MIRKSKTSRAAVVVVNTTPLGLGSAKTVFMLPTFFVSNVVGEARNVLLKANSRVVLVSGLRQK